MKIDKLLKDCAASINALSNRLEIQNRACHNPSDKADVNEWIEDCRTQVAALQCIATSYGPIMQASIDAGMAGQKHHVLVERDQGDKFEWYELLRVVFEPKEATK